MSPIRGIVKTLLPQRVLEGYRDWRAHAELNPLARELKARDDGPLPADPGNDAAIAAMTQWLCDAQDGSASHDGGFARHYDPRSGWSPSYPETTGYIVPTLIDESARTGNAALAERARRATDWLCDIQFDDGAFQGGMITELPKARVTFNTGQILLGLAASAKHFDDARYREAARRAAQWLVDTQDEDGAWRRFGSPFTEQGEKAYETHVSWGLLEADRVVPGHGFGAAALRQIGWALTKQDASNGWFADNCLARPDAPLTHTIGYVLRGVVEGYRHTPEPRLLAAANATAAAIAAIVAPDGRLAGRLTNRWEAAVDWVCLTGTVQIAHSFLLLDALNGDNRLGDTARRMNAYVRRTVRLDGPVGVRGGVKGSHPIQGGYGHFEYLNWAAKFAIDALRAEQDASR